jgi:hypothetical protein
VISNGISQSGIERSGAIQTRCHSNAVTSFTTLFRSHLPGFIKPAFAPSSLRSQHGYRTSLQNKGRCTSKIEPAGTRRCLPKSSSVGSIDNSILSPQATLCHDRERHSEAGKAIFTTSYCLAQTRIIPVRLKSQPYGWAHKRRKFHSRRRIQKDLRWMHPQQPVTAVSRRDCGWASVKRVIG